MFSLDVKVGSEVNLITKLVVSLLLKVTKDGSGLLHLFTTSPNHAVILNDKNFTLPSSKHFSRISSYTKASLFGKSIAIPFQNGKILLSTGIEVLLLDFGDSCMEGSVSVGVFIQKNAVVQAVQFSRSKGCEYASPNGDFGLKKVLGSTRNGVVYFSAISPQIGITLNESWDRSVLVDMWNSLNDVCNKDPKIKGSIVGPTQAVPLVKSSLVTGTWQGLWICQFSNGTNYMTTVSQPKRCITHSIRVNKSRGFHSLRALNDSWMNDVSKVGIGLVHFFIKHTSACVVVHSSGNEKGLARDIDGFIKENMSYYQHIYEGSDDMPAHIKTAVLGSHVSLPISKGKLVLAEGEDLLFAEFRDHSRQRTITIVIEEF